MKLTIERATKGPQPALPDIARESKPGYRTTEFWITILTLILNNLSVLPIPDRFQGITNVAAIVGYQLSRGLAKHGVPNTPSYGELEAAGLIPSTASPEDEEEGDSVDSAPHIPAADPTTIVADHSDLAGGVR